MTNLNEEQFREHVAGKQKYRLEEGPGYREVTAYTSRGALAGFINWQHYNKETGGHDPSADPTIHRVQVGPTHRRKGLATALYSMAKDLNPALQHSHALTPDGRAWNQGLQDKGIDG